MMMFSTSIGFCVNSNVFQDKPSFHEYTMWRVACWSLAMTMRAPWSPNS